MHFVLFYFGLTLLSFLAQCFVSFERFLLNTKFERPESVFCWLAWNFKKEQQNFLKRA